jgi:hypothetical protein
LLIIEVSNSNKKCDFSFNLSLLLFILLSLFSRAFFYIFLSYKYVYYADRAMQEHDDYIYYNYYHHGTQEQYTAISTTCGSRALFSPIQGISLYSSILFFSLSYPHMAIAIYKGPSCVRTYKSKHFPLFFFSTCD